MICVEGARKEIPRGLCAGSSREGLGRIDSGMKGTQEASGYILPLRARLSQPQPPDHIATSPSLPGLLRCKASDLDRISQGPSNMCLSSAGETEG